MRSLQLLVVSAIVLQAAIACRALARPEATVLPCLTNATQVRFLSADEARNGYPVRLSGVVLYVDPPCGDLIIQDKTGGMYVSGWTSRFDLPQLGQLVRVAGVSVPGDYSPCVVMTNLEILGMGTIPPPQQVSYGDLSSGFAIGHWVEVRGIVRSAVLSQVASNRTNQYLVMQLSVGGDKLIARMPDFRGVRIGLLPDAEVRVRGIPVPMFTTRRQLYDVAMLVPSPVDLTIDLPEPAHPFDIPTSPIGSLLQYSATRAWGHRVKVAGTVLRRLPGEMFIKDGKRAICVYTDQTKPVMPGGRVEVLGFPAHGQYSPDLEDAVFRKTGSGPPPPPTPVSVEEASNGNLNDDLVQIDALLLNTFRYGGEEILVLEQSNFVFNVHLPDNDQTRKLELLPRGSLLRVRGICEIQLNNWQRTFQLLCQSPDDVAVVRPPVWWNLRHALGLLAGVTVCFAAVLGIVVGRSRQRINKHLRAWQQAEAQFAAVNRERNRLAGELHDSLEQALVGIGLQLEAGLKAFRSAPNAAIEHLELAKQMVDQSQDEVHRSVWDLRSQMLDNNDLPSALDAIGKHLSHGTDIQFGLEILGAKRRLPDGMENHLLRITQEAVANAIKHGQARRVEVQLAFEPSSVALTVRDDGSGFDTGTQSVSQPGHFGLAGMRARAKVLGGTIEVESKPGRGTTITVEAPVADKAEALKPA